MASLEMSYQDKYYQRDSRVDDVSGGGGEKSLEFEMLDTEDEVCLDDTNSININEEFKSSNLTILEAANLCVPDETYVLDGFFPCAIDPSLYARYQFPSYIDNKLLNFDNNIILLIQYPLLYRETKYEFISTSLIFIARLISSMFAASEIGFAIPVFILLLERLDSLAILST